LEDEIMLVNLPIVFTGPAMFQTLGAEVCSEAQKQFAQETNARVQKFSTHHVSERYGQE
jgi:hypothetical protein